jgi:hypothetical protein
MIAIRCWFATLEGNYGIEYSIVACPLSSVFKQARKDKAIENDNKH